MKDLHLVRVLRLGAGYFIHVFLAGFLLLIAEAVYTLTDPPLRLLRRVIPPVRLGQVQFDLAFLILLIGLQILINLALLI